MPRSAVDPRTRCGLESAYKSMRASPSMELWRTRRRSAFLRGALVGLSLLGLPWSGLRAESAIDARYNLMAAFLYNFASFVEWPSDPQLDKGPIVIGVLGENPFAAAAPAIEKKTVNGRAIRFKVFPDLSALEPTHILFISREAAAQLPQVRHTLEGRAVLTVGETEDFTRRGGVVRFFEIAAAPDAADAARTLRLEINETLANSMKLQIRSKLLRLASVVDYPSPAEP